MILTNYGGKKKMELIFNKPNILFHFRVITMIAKLQ